MASVKNYLQNKALERIPAPLMENGGKGLVVAIDKAVETRWDDAIKRAAEAEGVTMEEKIASASKAISKELVSLGAATGAAAAAPGLGTAAAVSMLVAEVGWFGLRASDMIMTIGALYGRTDSTPEERRAWVLSVLAFGEQAAEEFAVLVGNIDSEVNLRGGKVGAMMAGIMQGDRATVEALRRVNTRLASRVIAKYGSRKGVLMIGRLIPFGVGAAVGGVANWGLSRAIVTHARRFFDSYPMAGLDSPPPPLNSQRSAIQPPAPKALPVPKDD